MRKIQFLVWMLLCLCTTLVTAQKSSNDYPVFDKVEKALTKTALPQFTIVTPSSSSLVDEAVPKTELENGLVLDLDVAAISTLRAQKPEAVQLSFPLTKNENVSVSLVQNKVLTPDFILRESANPEAEMDYTPGLYYHGVIDNDPQSLVSISVFDDEIIGTIHTQEANFVIGKLNNTTTQKHVIYNDKELANDLSLDCATPDDGVVYEYKDLTFDMSKAVGDCVRVHFEIDDDIVTNKGGATGATNYITGLMNEVITLYANDNLSMAVSEIFAWTTPAPYSGSSSSAMLSSYQANTGAFNGDLSHLVSYQASGGIAAGFSGICNSNVDESKCFSSIDASYANVPTYSFTVMVVTHEMGHLIGSRHTHACVWNGNGTAIDGCAGGTEGSCSLPPSPPSGGTIMSYCHLTTGIDFTQGFGSQPQAVILNTVANATCLSACSGPTCSDGVQNGDETGVDCGGSTCPPCNSGCNDNDVNVNFVFDNYPEETSWNITNAGGSVVASGGTYGGQPDGSSLSIPLCLVDGCYDFTIFDSYGDGICCGYGNGSYSVTDGSGNVLASGGQFGSSETTNFCFNGAPVLGCTDPGAHNYDPAATQDDGSCETCSDNIQNGDETGVDCGGNLCNACPGGSNTVFAHFFETGWDGWADGGSDCYRYSGSRSWEGSYSIRIRDNSGTASSMTSSAYNMSGYSSADLEFYFYPNSMETGEDFWLQVNSGSGWVTVASYASGTSFNNNSFYVSTVNITNLSSSTQFRFRCDASGNADRVYIDAVTLTGNTGGALVEDKITITKLDDPIRGLDEGSVAMDDLEDKSVVVYPNPAGDFLNVETTQIMSQIKVYSANGNLVNTLQVSEEKNEELDISQLAPGFYYLSIETNEGVVNTKFVKL